MPEPRIRRLHTHDRPGRAQPGAASGGLPPAFAPEAMAGGIVAGDVAEPESPRAETVVVAALAAGAALDGEPRLAPDEAESAEAEAVALAAVDVAADGGPGTEAVAVAAAAAAAAVVVTGSSPEAEAPPEAGAQPESEAQPEAEAQSGREAIAVAAAESPPESVAQPEAEAGEAALDEPTAEEANPDEAAGWIRETELEAGAEEAEGTADLAKPEAIEEIAGLDLDGWPVGAAEAAAAEAVAEAGAAEGAIVEAGEDEGVVRERDRPVMTPLPDGEASRRRSRLHSFLVGVVTIFAVAVVGFVAGLMLPVILPGPGIDTGTASPIPAASGAATPATTATPGSTGAPTPAPTPVATAAPTPAPTQIVHVVQPGEQLGRIAARYGVTVAAIQAANNLANPNLIHVGQKLIIPPPTASPAP
jgi:LysM repeat protein